MKIAVQFLWALIELNWLTLKIANSLFWQGVAVY